MAGSALSNFPITLESSAKFTYVHTVRHKICFGKIQTHSTETRSKRIAYILRTVHLIRKFLEEPLFLYAKKNVLNAKNIILFGTNICVKNKIIGIRNRIHEFKCAVHAQKFMLDPSFLIFL